MILSVKVVCDWPGCARSVTVPADASLQDRRWEARDDASLASEHLCPDHRHRTWYQLDAARTAAASRTEEWFPLGGYQE